MTKRYLTSLISEKQVQDFAIAATIRNQDPAEMLSKLVNTFITCVKGTK